MKRIIALLLAVTCWLTLWLPCMAESTSTTGSALLLKGTDFTANQTVAAALDVVFATYGPGTYFTDNGKPCTDHQSDACCTDTYDCNCRRVLDDGTDLLAWQCFGFARYVFYTCFGFIDRADIVGDRVYSLGEIPAGQMTAKNVKDLLSGAKTGAHIRVSGHSMALLSTDAESITVIHANIRAQCDVVLQTFTWQEFVDRYQWQGIDYVNMPDPYPAGDSTTLPPTSSQTVEEGVYTLKNVSSGRLLQVNGRDENEAPVNTGKATADNVKQQFRLEYAEGGRYYLRAMCSSDGQNRVVDIIRAPDKSMAGGNLLEIYTAVDAGAQLFRLVPLGDGSYAIEVAASRGVAITDTPQATSQITVEKYTGDALQRWQLTRLDAPPPPVPTDDTGVYQVRVNEGSTLKLRKEPVSGTVLVYIPYNTYLPVSRVDNGWAYAYYNGYEGWVSLDFAAKIRPLGDVNGDGAVGVDDALEVLRGVTGKANITPVQIAAAGVSDGRALSVDDALRLLRYITGKNNTVIA